MALDKAADQESGNPPLNIFIAKSKNMLHIWENIICHLSGTDVARVLRVTTSVRAAIVQCLDMSTNLRSRVDLAVTSSAIKEAIATRADFPVQLQKNHFQSWPWPTFLIVALDGVLLAQGRTDVSCTDVLQIDTRSDSSSTKWIDSFPSFFLVRSEERRGGKGVFCGVRLRGV